jgi:hypothetical protein
MDSKYFRHREKKVLNLKRRLSLCWEIITFYCENHTKPGGKHTNHKALKC